MANNRPVRRSFFAAASIAAALFLGTSTVADAQEVSVQKLVERGALTEALAQAETERGNLESTFLAAQASTKLENLHRANEEYWHLRESDSPDWKAIGESGSAMMAGDLNTAMAAARRAVDANGSNPYAHYQLGVIASRQNAFDVAAAAFGRATELKSDFAYAHYYAGLANQRLRQTAKMSEHLEAFMRIAPDAPERPAVSAILRTLRPR